MTTTPEVPETIQPHDEIYAAEQLIRADHTVSDPMWKFWSEIADWMNDMAMRGKHGWIGTNAWKSPTWSQFNGCLAAARSYTEQHERLNRHCQDPQCDDRQITVTFFPCDAGDTLGELRRRVPSRTLKAVGHAIVSA